MELAVPFFVDIIPQDIIIARQSLDFVSNGLNILDIGKILAA